MSACLIRKVKSFLISEDGPTAVEYAVLLALMVGMMITAIMYVGFEAQEVSEDVVTGLDEAPGDPATREPRRSGYECLAHGRLPSSHVVFQ